MCDKSKLNEILKQVRQEYENVCGDKLVKVVLYGSYAREDFESGSDIDIVGIVRGEREELQKKEKQIWNLTNKIDLKYDILTAPIVIPYDEFINYKEVVPYYKNIEKEGIEIVA